ncbi:MAG: hypothetical protein AAF802_20185 [Planctomycetota bacterium]
MMSKSNAPNRRALQIQHAIMYGGAFPKVPLRSIFLMPTPNPYRPPVLAEETSQSWWEKCKRLLNLEDPSEGVRFRQGEGFIVNGIVFHVDRNDPQYLFAASPSAKSDNARMELVIEEAIRSVPMLIEDFPQVRGIIQNRFLAIQLLDDYRVNGDRILRQTKTNLDCETILSSTF